MCRETLLILIWTLTTSSTVTLPSYPTVVEIFGNDVSEAENLYFIVLNGKKVTEHQNMKIQKDNDEFLHMPIDILANRRQYLRPSVEAGPGAFKSEIVQYPPDILKKQLNNLLKLKEKLNAQTKDKNVQN